MDKRKNNGGNSTKAKGIDKRKNPYKMAVLNAVTDEELTKLIKVIYKKAIKDEDVQASKVVLEYCLGKPKQQMDITTDGDGLNAPIINFTKRG